MPGKNTDLRLKQRHILLTTAVIVCLSYLIAIGFSAYLNFRSLEKSRQEVSLNLLESLPDIFDNALNGSISVVKRAAHEKTLLELLERGSAMTPEEEGEMWKQYLTGIQAENNFTSVELVRESSQRYFTSKGFRNIIDLDKEPHDIWYVNFRDSKADMWIAFDTSVVNDYKWMVFTTVPIRNNDGKFEGALSIGVPFDEMQYVLRSMEERYQMEVHLIDPIKKLQLRYVPEPLTAETEKFLSEMMGSDFAIHTRDDGFTAYKYLPKLGWYFKIDYNNKAARGMIFDTMKESLAGLFFVGLISLLALHLTMGRRQEELVEEAAERITDMEDASKAKSSFLANMSHEIRTPINTIIGLNTMTLRRAADSTVRGYAEDIKRASNVLLNLINDILDLSKIESGRMDIVPVEYDTALLLSDVMDMTRTRAAGKELDISLQVPESLPRMLLGDDVRIRQILTNILTNAVKYTDKGSVTLEVSWERQADSALLTLGVRDTGIGLRPEDVAHITEKFIRFDTRKNRLVEGAGLGLTITSQLLELMGSHLEVQSTYGKGSFFYFVLSQPIVDETPIGDISQYKHTKETDDTEYRSLFTAPEAHVLVADDNTMNLNVFCQLLSDTGMNITTCTNGEELVRLSQEKKYDIIYTDHMMPVMDGVEAFMHIRHDPDNPNTDTPVILLTANAIAGAKEEYLTAGFNGYISKPIDAAKLEEMTRDMLPPELLKPGVVVERIQCEHCETDTIVEELPQIEGFHLGEAARLAHTPQLLFSILQDFHDSAAAEADKLDACYEALPDNCEPYRIQVHAMKSNAATAGALGVSLMARILEHAAADKDVDTIRSLHAVFLAQWRQLPERLESLEQIKVSEAVTATEHIDRAIPPELFAAALERIAASMADFDTDGAMATLKSVLAYDHPEETRARLQELARKINDFDDDGALEIIKEIKS